MLNIFFRLLGIDLNYTIILHNLIIFFRTIAGNFLIIKNRTMKNIVKIIFNN